MYQKLHRVFRESRCKMDTGDKRSLSVRDHTRDRSAIDVRTICAHI